MVIKYTVEKISRIMLIENYFFYNQRSFLHVKTIQF